MLTVGSLCTGYGGIELGLRAAGWPVKVAWVADKDPAATKLLAYRHPDVTNLGDISRTDWAAVTPVDILTAGFPCQDVSVAGLRRGITPDTRSGVWYHVAAAINTLRPPLVLLENVEGILSARAHSDLEPCPWCVGTERGGDPQSSLRALGAVLGDLSELGYDAVWTTVAASDVGACHRRRRVFILAWPADTTSLGQRYPWAPGGKGVPSAAVGGAVRPDSLNLLPTPAARLADKRGMPSQETAAARMYEKGRRNLEDVVALLPTPAARDAERGFGYGDQPGRPLSETIARLLPTPRTNDARGASEHGDGGPDLRTAVSLLPTPRATDGTKGGPNQRGSSGDLMLPSAVMLLPTPTATPYGNNQSQSAGAAVRLSLDSLAANALLPTPVAQDAESARNATVNRRAPKPTTATTGWTLSDVAYADRWGQYAPAIARWEQVLGRPAPDPTEPGSKGQPRLSPRFVEWMQGLPEGHVTAAPGLSRNDMLRLLGNGVVPLQCGSAVMSLAAVRTNALSPH